MKNVSLIENNLGKIPPQAIDFEEAVIGAVMLEEDAYMIVSETLKPESFYKAEHQEIFKAIASLSAQAKPIDLLTVTECLRESGKLDEVGGPFYLSKLTARIASAAHIEHHARIVHDKFILRQIIKLSTEAQNKAFNEDGDVIDLLNDLNAKMANVNAVKRQGRMLLDAANDRIVELEQISKNKECVYGVPSGFEKVDNVTSGFQPGNLIIIAARPSMGKTTVSLQMAVNACLEGKTVLFLSMEMSEKEIVDCIISMLTGLDRMDIRNGNMGEMEWELINNAYSKIEEMNLIIDDQSSLSIQEIKAKCYSHKRHDDIDLVIVDYLQLAKDKTAKQRIDEIGNISMGLKAIAKDLDIPVIALSQLNRSVESRPNNFEGKIPQLSDLRESGQIEQDADLIFFIYRPEYYNIMQDSDYESTERRIWLVLSKHRNGKLGTVKLERTENWSMIN